MRRFMKVSVPTEGYAEVKQVGTRYVVHLEGVANEGDGTTTCYECMVDEAPDMDVLRQELAEYKEYIGGVELRMAKEARKKVLMAYDSSPSVNSFEIRRGGVKMTDYWIERDLRTSLEGDVMACSAKHETYNFDIREMGITLPLNCTKFLAALNTLREYAYTAYNVTSAHLAAIDALATVDAVEAYDFTTGYPEKLVFDIDTLV